MSMIAMDAFLRQARAGGDGRAGHTQPSRLKGAPTQIFVSISFRNSFEAT